MPHHLEAFVDEAQIEVAIGIVGADVGKRQQIVHLQVVNIPGIRTYTVANSNGKHVVVATAEGEESAGETLGSYSGDSTTEAQAALAGSAENGVADRARDDTTDDDPDESFADKYDGDLDDSQGDTGDNLNDGEKWVEESTDQSPDEGWLDDQHSPGEPTRRE